MKKENAITLVALVLTIIILIIISSVSIGLLLGNNGLINRAKTAKSEYQNAVDDENKKLEEIYSRLLLADSEGTSLENIDMTTLKRLILDTTYPVGSIYITTDNKNPSESLGGTWEKYSQGRTLIGDGEYQDKNGTTKTFAVGDTDEGEYNHTLTIGEMPSHNHQSSLYLDQSGYGRSIPVGYGYYKAISSGTMDGNWTSNAMTNRNSWIIGDSTYKGDSQSHNNIQPYITTYIWKRIS